MACALPLPFLPRLDFGPGVESPFRFLPAEPVLVAGAPCDDVGLELAAAACRVDDLVPAIAIVDFNRWQRVDDEKAKVGNRILGFANKRDKED